MTIDLANSKLRKHQRILQINFHKHTKPARTKTKQELAQTKTKSRLGHTDSTTSKKNEMNLRSKPLRKVKGE